MHGVRHFGNGKLENGRRTAANGRRTAAVLERIDYYRPILARDFLAKITSIQESSNRDRASLSAHISR